MSEVTARAVYFTGEKRVEVQTVAVEPAPEDVLVTSRLIGISHGTELLCYRGQLPEVDSEETLGSLPSSLSYPLRYGYINVGERRDGGRVFAFYPHQDRFALPETETVALPAGLGDEDAVFLASMETALGIVHDASPRLGEIVAVFGTGVVGLLTAALLVRSGARVIAVEPAAFRRATASELGCAVVDPESEDARARLRAENDGNGVDVAINTSGSDAGLQAAIDAVSVEGLVVEASWHGAAASTLRLGDAFHRRRITVRSSQVSRLAPTLMPRWSKQRRLRLAMELLQEVTPRRFISHRFALSEAARAFELVDSDPSNTLQVVLDPRR